MKTFGRLDILVNNAGVVTVAPIDEFKLEDFERLVAVNVKGVFVAVQEAVRHMKEGGRIINIGSINSDFVPFVGGSVYALTKGAIAGFTRGLARDLGPRGITVNSIQPGPVDTDMNPADGSFASQVIGMIAVQRYGHGEEIAGLVSYVASAGARFHHRREPADRRRFRSMIPATFLPSWNKKFWAGPLPIRVTRAEGSYRRSAGLF